MNLLVVGGGGREHAIIQKLKENPSVTQIYALPGNGGIAQNAQCVPIAATDIPAITDFAVKHHIGFAVVAPDDPLVLGATDALEDAGIPVFGPRKNAAIIEGSKVFAKQLMQKYHIPTAAYGVFTNLKEALDYMEDAPLPTVIKADGLALGKGVIIAQTRQEARNALRSMLEDKIFGESGNRVIIEEYLTGPEVSVLSFTDGETVVPMVSSMDHKRAKDGDQGLNTGGMGTVAPNPYYTPEIAQICMDTIFLPTIRAMKAEGRPFRGCLYFGLMLTPEGPKVIEYNCRFGDPETQVVLPLLETDLLTVMQATAAGKLAQTPISWKSGSACCVVLASEGYPTHYEKGFPITLPQLAGDEHIFIAGAKEENGRLITSGGRVLGAVSVKDSLAAAIQGAYDLAGRIQFDNAYCRHDIGQKALAAKEEC